MEIDLGESVQNNVYIYIYNIYMWEKGDCCPLFLELNDGTTEMSGTVQCSQ